MHGTGSVKVCVHVVRFFILTFSVRFQFPFPLIKINFNFGTHRQKVFFQCAPNLNNYGYGMFSKVKFEINLVLAKIYGLKLKFKLSRIGKNIWLIEKIFCVQYV